MIADEPNFDWLNYDSRPGAWMADASCFTFIRNRSAEWAVSAAKLDDVTEVDWSDTADWDDRFSRYGIALFGTGDWTVIYQYAGFPAQFARNLAAKQDVDEAVIVFWNVNGVIEFNYWQQGAMLVRFNESPDERHGADPDALLAAMGRAAVTATTYESSGGENGPLYYRSLLTLAADITGIVLGADFLQRPLTVAVDNLNV